MAVYYILISVLAGLGYIFTEKKQNAKAAATYLSVAFVCLVFIASFRYAIGFDYFSYRNIYQMTSGMSFSDILLCYRYEPLFYLSCKIFSMHGLPFTFFLTCINCFFIFSALWFIYRYCKIPWMGVYFFITLQFLAYDMNLLRQSTALCFFMFAYPYLKNRKLVPYTLIMLAGGLFHNSLWFVYPLYVLLPVKYSRKTALAVTGAAAAGYLMFDSVFENVVQYLPIKYVSYQYSYYWNASSFSYVILPLVYLVLIYLHRSMISDPMKRCIYLNSAFYHFLISLFITKHFILERFAIYPFVVSLAAIADITSCYQKNAGSDSRQARAFHFVRLQFLVFGAAYFLFAAARGFHNVYPYISLLSKSSAVPIP